MSLRFENMLGYSLEPWNLMPEASGPRSQDEDVSSLEGDVASNTSGDSVHSLGVSASSGGEEIQSPPPRAGAAPRTSSSGQAPARHKPDFTSGAQDASKKPPHSYIKLISQAILDSDDKRLLLGDIYAYIADHFPYYKHTEDKAWKNSVRHNLSLNECFTKNGRSDNGKGNFWSIHPACVDDFRRGDFRRRQARRRAKRCHQPQLSTAPPAYQLPYPYSQLSYGSQMPCGYQQPGYGLHPAYQQQQQQQPQQQSSPSNHGGLLMMSSPNSTVSPGSSPMTSPISPISSYNSGYSTPTSLPSYAGYLQAHKSTSGAPPNVNSTHLNTMPVAYPQTQLYPAASQLYSSVPQLPVNKDYSQLFSNYYSTYTQ